MRYLALPEKKGPAAARNLGWLSAKAPVIAFTDDDCVPHSHWLEAIVNAADPARAQAFSGTVVVPRAGRPTDHELNTAGLETAEFVTANCACTRSALYAVGGFDERFSMAWREDSDLEFQLICNSVPITRIKTAIVVHPVRDASWGVSIREQKKTLFNALLYRKYPQLYRSKIQPLPPLLYYMVMTAFLTFIIGLTLHLPLPAFTGGITWLVLTFYFIGKRLYRTSLAGGHVLEMVFTSFVIPFFSIYWQWYGAVKYRVLFI